MPTTSVSRSVSFHDELMVLILDIEVTWEIGGEKGLHCVDLEMDNSMQSAGCISYVTV
jgi:hypothetical protein